MKQRFSSKVYLNTSWLLSSLDESEEKWRKRKSSSLCEKDAFTERGVICFHTAISHWKSIDCDLQESEFRNLTIPFGLKMYPSMIDVRDIPQWGGGLVSHGDTEDNNKLERESVQSVTALLQTQPGTTLPPQPRFVGGRKVSPQEGQTELRGAIPLHGHTALE